MTLAILVAVIGGLTWLAQREPHPATAKGPARSAPGGAALRIGVIPERDIFAQRRRYLALGDYLSGQLDRPVKFVTLRTYQAAFHDFASQEIDAAFLGSMAALLSIDRFGAQVLLKPELAGQITTYHGVIFVRGDSPIERVADLAGRSIAMVKTTTAGELFPLLQMKQAGLLNGPEPPQIAWSGTHDEVILDVIEGHADAGAAKNLRLDAFVAAHPEQPVRRLAESDPVPNNALILRADLADELGPELARVMLRMDQDAEGRQALAAFGAVRFVPCRAEEYAPICAMVEQLGPMWAQLGVTGPAPTRQCLGLRRQ